MNAKSKTVLIAGAGSFGYWNTGDEAILDAMVRDLRSHVPDLNIALVSANPPGTMAAYALEEIPSQDITQIVHAAQASDLLILGGGGIFYDYWGFDPSELLTMSHGGMGLYSGFALLATLLKKPLMIYGVGVGPLLSEFGKSFTRAAFEQATLATVRDPESKQLLASLGVDVARVRVTADPALTLPSADDERVRQIIGAEASTPLARPVVGVALRNWNIGVSPDYWEREVALGLDSFVEQHGGTILFVPFHRAVKGSQVNDRAVAKRVRKRMRNQAQAVVFQGNYLPEEKAGVLKSCDLVLGMRLHSILFACQYGVPTIALAYDPKVSNSLKQFDCDEYGIELGALNADRLAALLWRAYGDRSQLGARLIAKANALVDLSRENARLAADLLAGNVSVTPALSPQTADLINELGVTQTLRVHDLQRTVQSLTTQVGERDQQVGALHAQIQAEVTAHDQQIGALHAQIAAITSSTSWALIQVLWRIRLWVAPHGSRRERVLRQMMQTFRTVRQDGLLAAARKVIRRMLKWFTSVFLSPVARLLPHSQKDKLKRSNQRAVSPAPAELGLALESAQQLAPVRHASTKTRPARTRAGGKPRIAYLTNQLLDWETREPRFGGGERYCMTLSTLLNELGFEVTLFQAAHDSFETEYYGLKVIALPLMESFSEFHFGVGNAFHRASLDYEHVLYNLPEYASGEMRPDALLICHGIWFDHENYGPTYVFRSPEWFQHLYRAFSQPARIVSVDTNSINVIRSLWPPLANRMTYLPNWVDPQVFHPPQPRSADRLTVLFPRRSQVNRGSRILEAILRNIPHDCRFWWVGEGDAEDTQIIQALTRKDPRLEYFSAPFEEMPRYYQQADICVIPTIACEGTSLAALEGLASGCAMVATNVGGLPDLIQPEVNGLLVDPDPKEIAAAINFLIENPAARTHFQQTAPLSVEKFGLEHWRKRWTRLLTSLGWLDT